MSRVKNLLSLYWAFFKIGGLTFGGGLVMLPMLEHELVTNRGWITSDELLDCYAIGQCTPGIIAVNTATFVGCKKQGVSGGIFSTLGMISPSLIIITLVASVLKNFMDNVTFAHALMGIRGVVCALLVNTVVNLTRKSLVSRFSCAVFVLVLAASFFLKLPTILLVVSAAALGIIADAISKRGDAKRNPESERGSSDKNGGANV